MLICRLDVRMSHHAAEQLRCDTGLDCAGGKGVAATVGGHICAADFIHQLFNIPLLEIDRIAVSFVSVDQSFATG